MRDRIRGMLNFAMNIKDLMLKLQKTHGPIKLTAAEANLIVQYYLESNDVLSALDTEIRDMLKYIKKEEANKPIEGAYGSKPDVPFFKPFNDTGN